MGEVANALSQHTEQREARLKATFGVIRVKVLADRNAPDGRASVAELSETPLRVEACEKWRTGSR